MPADPKTNDPPRKGNAARWRERQRLDGKPRSLPRGRHAKRSDGEPPADKPADDKPADAPRAVPIHQRLGYRPAEFAALTGLSYVTVWRQIKNRKIDVIDQGGIKMIPRSYAIKAGYITENDI